MLEDESLAFHTLLQYMSFAAPRFLQVGDDDTQASMQSVRDLMEYCDADLLGMIEEKVGWGWEWRG